MLKGINISKSFGSKEVLKNINVEVIQGKATVIMGPSGSGKTTLLRCLAQLDVPDSGTIEIDQEIYTFPSKNHYKPPYPLVTVVYQQLFLWPHLTNRGNVTLAVKDTYHEKKLEE